MDILYVNSNHNSHNFNIISSANEKGNHTRVPITD